MIIWDILNNAEPITMVSENYSTVCATVLVLGYGHYGARECHPLGKARELPIFAYWKEAAMEQWFQDTFNCDMGTFLKSQAPRAVARVLRTTQVCSPEERLAYQKALEAMVPEKQQDYARWWKEQRQASPVDIVKTAWYLAERMENHAAKSERESGLDANDAIMALPN